jgi:hypothetical protein
MWVIMFVMAVQICLAISQMENIYKKILGEIFKWLESEL